MKLVSYPSTIKTLDLPNFNSISKIFPSKTHGCNYGSVRVTLKRVHIHHERLHEVCSA